VRLSRWIAVLSVVFAVLAVVAFVSAVSSREVNTLSGDEPLELAGAYAFLALAIISFVSYLAAVAWSRSRSPSTAPRHFVGEDDRGPGEVRTRVRDGEVKRVVGGKW
jgi:hypothetical protein